MACWRCGQKGCANFNIKFLYPSGNGTIIEVCRDCCHDIENFAREIPRYNQFGCNMEAWEQKKKCDTSNTRGWQKEENHVFNPGNQV